MNFIYTVTVFNAYEDGKLLTDRFKNDRTWGWFPTREEAEADIRASNNDLYFESGTYQYALIEEVPPGMMGGLDTRKGWWFKVDYDGNDKYEITPIEKPAFNSHTICFSMG